jgi:hypothetical protein
MATCNIEDLTSQACLSGFFGQTPVTSLAIELQLVKNFSGDTSTLDSLMLQACASGFVGQDTKASKGIELQLWCDYSTNTPPTCDNLVPIGTLYTNQSGGGVTLSILTPGATYKITFGLNDTRFHYIDANGDDQNIDAPGTFQFINGATTDALFLGL